MTLLLAAEEGANPLFPNVWEMLITGIGFLILLFLVVKFVVPAFERVYRERTEAIEGGLAKAKAAQAEAAAARDEYNQQLESARLEAQKIREEARLEGEKILADFKDRANAESARITENAHRTIEAERSAAGVAITVAPAECEGCRIVGCEALRRYRPRRCQMVEAGPAWFMV